MQEKTIIQINYELLFFYSKLSRNNMTIKEYWERKLLDEIYDYIDNIKDLK